MPTEESPEWGNKDDLSGGVQVGGAFRVPHIHEMGKAKDCGKGESKPSSMLRGNDKWLLSTNAPPLCSIKAVCEAKGSYAVLEDLLQFTYAMLEKNVNEV